MRSFDTFQNLIVEHGEIKMPIFRNGENIELTQLQAFLDILFKQAAKGNAKAMGLYMAAQREAADAKRVFREGILFAANEHIERWLHVFLLNERKGKPMPDLIYPDPRDIIINPDGSVDIIGPINLQHHLLVEEMITHRDEYLEVWDQVLSAGAVPQSEVKLTWRMCNKNIEKWNSAIPPRLRKSLPPLETYVAE